MADLFFPQLSTGAMAQYPIRKTRLYRTIKNVLADGRLILHSDRPAKRVQWELSYSNLADSDVQALQDHYRVCDGPLRAFTFLDPTGNLFTSSEDLTMPAWLQNIQVGIELSSDSALRANNAFRLTNAGQVAADFYQGFQIPANYSYCLSMYIKSSQLTPVTIFRRGASTAASQQFLCGPDWKRVYLSGALPEQGEALEAGLTLLPGQQLSVCGLQMEAQLAPSDYRPTGSRSGIYPASYYSMNELLIHADAFGLFSTNVLLEAAE